MFDFILMVDPATDRSRYDIEELGKTLDLSDSILSSTIALFKIDIGDGRTIVSRS